ncbi:MGMT family protein [Intrasporangium sp.]|uniref:MGMT family protein n=1 Tax=Intrasporangium sp. TaxID=1925024 RepID=UPI00293AFB98|nr:MGMT family protein [Intrasporangium sp.]MDV3221059.1 MGMT family protein [Intrasporangium sp.]
MEDYAQRVLEVVARIPPGRVVAYGDIARALGEGGARNVGTVMSRYGADVPWWRVIRADGRPPQGHDAVAIEHWRAEGTPMVRGLLEGGRVDMAAARWPIPETRSAPGGRGGLHHVELWVADIGAAKREWGWLLGRLGYRLGDDWGHGQAWELGPLYIVIESGPDVSPGRHERTRPGLNHLAFRAGSRQDVDDIVAARSDGGWTLMFTDRHPFAGGPQHYAAYLESGEGFEVELVAE